MRKIYLIVPIFVLVFVIVYFAVHRQSRPEPLEAIQLPPPQMSGGSPLMDALSARQSHREFSSRALPQQVLSNLLWAAFGINRPDGRRTAPSTMNWQGTRIYVAMRDGLYIYNPGENVLDPVMAEDIRDLTGEQDFVINAPVNIIYVADFSVMGGYSVAKEISASAETGFISQNVYLFCASQGLNTIVHGHLNRKVLAEKIGLDGDHRITYAQTVGFPP